MPDMKILCDICGGNIAEATCKRCGRRVCSMHYDTKSGWCSSCKAGTR